MLSPLYKHINSPRTLQVHCAIITYGHIEAADDAAATIFFFPTAARFNNAVLFSPLSTERYVMQSGRTAALWVHTRTIIHCDVHLLILGS